MRQHIADLRCTQELPDEYELTLRRLVLQCSTLAISDTTRNSAIRSSIPNGRLFVTRFILHNVAEASDRLLCEWKAVIYSTFPSSKRSLVISLNSHNAWSFTFDTPRIDPTIEQLRTQLVRLVDCIVVGLFLAIGLYVHIDWIYAQIDKNMI